MVNQQQGPHRAPLPSEINVVPEFHGNNTDTHEPRQWLELLDSHAQMWNWSEQACLSVARIRLIGPAYHWLTSLPTSTAQTWEAFSDAFLARFDEPAEAALARLAVCRQEQGESVDSYADRFRRDVYLSGRQEDNALCHQFIAGLQRRLRFEVQRQPDCASALTNIISTARSWEVYFQEDQQQTIPATYVPPHRRNYEAPANRGVPRWPPSQSSRPLWNQSPYRSHYDTDNRKQWSFQDKHGNQSYRPYGSTYQTQAGNNAVTQQTPNQGKDPSAIAKQIDDLTQELENLQLVMDQLQSHAYVSEEAVYFMQPAVLARQHDVALSSQADDTQSDSMQCLSQAWTTLKRQVQDITAPHTHAQPLHQNYIMDYIEDADFDNDPKLDYSPYDDFDHYCHYYGPCRTPSMYARGDQNDNEPMRRAPRHRVALDPATFGARTGQPTTAARQNPADQSMPQPRTPFPVQGNGPPPTGSYRGPSHLRPPAPQRVSRDSNDPAQRADAVPLLSADILAESKGREMALKACRSLAIDASREANLVIPAAKICAAGILLNDTQLIERGRDTARRSDAYIRRLQSNTAASGAPGPSNPGPTAHTNVFLPTHEIYQFDGRTSLDADTDTASPTRLCTCRVMVKLVSPTTGISFLIPAIIDTGACQSAITVDVLRHMGLTGLID